MPLTFDLLLKDYIKPIGKWQISVFLLAMIPNTIPLMSILRFPNIAPNHVCASPWQLSQTWNYSQVLDLSMAIKNATNASADLSCYRFSNSLRFYYGNYTSLTDFIPEPCSVGQWRYDEATEEFRHSLVESFDLVCDRNYFISITPMCNLAGAFVGNLFGSVFSDHFGRKRVVSILTPIVAVILIALYFCNAYPLVVAAFFLLGVLSPVAFDTGFVLYVEMTNAKYRNLLAVIDSILDNFFGEGCILLLAYFTQDWRFICVGIGGIICISFVYPCFLTESPKWLIAKGRNEEALTTIRAAILTNGNTPERRSMASDLSVEDIMKTPNKEESDTVSVGILKKLGEVPSSYKRFLSIPKFYRTWIPLSIVWLCIMITDSGITFYAVRLTDDPYLMVLINMLIASLPGRILQWVLYHYFDRKRPVFVLSLISAVMSFAAFSISLYDPDQVAIAVLVSVVVCISTCLWSMVHLFSSELFPTLFRNNALGFLEAVGSIGAALGMLAERLDVYVWRGLPLLVYGIAQSLIALGIILLPTKKPCNSSVIATNTESTPIMSTGDSEDE